MNKELEERLETIEYTLVYILEYLKIAAPADKEEEGQV